MTTSLDQQIIEANAQMERLRQAAEAGDPVAQLLLRRLDTAKAEFARTYEQTLMSNAFGATRPADDLKLLVD